MGAAASEPNQMRSYGRDIDAGIKSDMGSDEIRADIEATRAEMSETVDAIQAKLSPQNVQETTQQVINQAKQAALEVAEQVTDRVKDSIRDATIGRVEKMAYNVRETTRGASSSLLETIKENPIPSALVGIGLAWLMMNRSSGSSGSRSDSSGRYYPEQGYYPDANRQYYTGDYTENYAQDYSQSQGGVRSRVGDVARNVQDKAGQVAGSASEAAGNVKEKAGEFVGRAQDRVSQLGDQVQNQAQRVAYRSQNMIEDNPLMAGALAVALGAAIGFVLPETQRENELMGEARDRLVSQASEVAQDTMGKVQQVAKEALRSAQDTVKEEAQNQGLTGNGNQSFEKV